LQQWCQTLRQCQGYKQLEASLQKDIKAFFGDYKNALVSATTLLYQISHTELMSAACLKATENGLGYLDADGALILHSALVEQLIRPVSIRG